MDSFLIGHCIFKYINLIIEIVHTLKTLFKYRAIKQFYSGKAYRLEYYTPCVRDNSQRPL